jgi:hypothetical protein
LSTSNRSGQRSDADWETLPHLEDVRRELDL